MATRILLVEDYTIIQEGLCSLIDKHPDMEVVGQADNGQKAVELALQLEPDIIIMDIEKSGTNGIEATQRIKAERPDIKILALSVHDDRKFVMGMVKAGVSGYLLKDCAFDDLVQAVRTVLIEGSYLSPKIATIVLEEEAGAHTSSENTKDSILLREHEIQVLRLLADGKSAKQIAEMLNMSVKTIEGNRRQIMKKLGIYNFAALVKYAVKKQLVSGNNVFVKP